jgi:hypothetical protein
MDERTVQSLLVSTKGRARKSSDSYVDFNFQFQFPNFHFVSYAVICFYVGLCKLIEYGSSKCACTTYIGISTYGVLPPRGVRCVV